MQNPLVSVLMVTYGHEAFLKQAIEGVLAQETDFKFELIIGDDNSPDNTQSIVENIVHSNENASLVYYKNQPNLGVMRNAQKAFNLAKGKYIALCEGDDYWLSTKKLEKQVQFLEAHTDYSICFHNTKVEFFENANEGYLLNADIEKDVFTLEDLIGEDEIWFMATASLVFSQAAFGNFPAWLAKSKSGDIPILILTARNGKIKYLPEVMAVYRKHQGGASLTDHKDDATFLCNRIFMYTMLRNSTSAQFHEKFNKNIARYYYLLVYCKQYKNNFFQRLRAGINYVYLTNGKGEKIGKDFWRDAFVPPWFLEFTRFIKRLLGIIPQ